MNYWTRKKWRNPISDTRSTLLLWGAFLNSNDLVTTSCFLPKSTDIATKYLHMIIHHILILRHEADAESMHLEAWPNARSWIYELLGKTRYHEIVHTKTLKDWKRHCIFFHCSHIQYIRKRLKDWKYWHCILQHCSHILSAYMQKHLKG